MSTNLQDTTANTAGSDDVADNANLDVAAGGGDGGNDGDDDEQSIPPPEAATDRGRVGDNISDQEMDLLKRERRARCECVSIVTLAIVIIIVTVVTVTVLAIQNKQRNDALQTPAPTPAPTIGINDPQLQLYYLLEALENNTNTAEYVSVITGEVTELEGRDADPNELPVVRAASWLTNVDNNNRDTNLIRRFALATIYYTNGGDDWYNNTNWLSEANHCQWYGVTCCEGFLDRVAPSCAISPDPHEIVYISLSNNNLVGNITNAYALLSTIQALDLGFNQMTGQLPGPVLGSLEQLMSISVQHNQMTGTIPQSLRRNKVLHTLFVQRNNFTGAWPRSFCYPALDKFGLDCDKVKCYSENCCHPDVFCYFD